MLLQNTDMLQQPHSKQLITIVYKPYNNDMLSDKNGMQLITANML